MSDSSQNEWNLGRIKVYNDERGFGFVRDEKDRGEHFFHITKVKTPPVSPHEYVLFMLRPSKKEEGKFEAFDLTHLSKSEDFEFLSSLFKEEESPSIRKEILTNLPDYAVQTLFKAHIKEIFENYSSTQYIRVKDLIQLYEAHYKDKKERSEVEEFFTSELSKYNSGKIIVDGWLDKIFTNPPNNEVLKSYFLEVDNRLRLKVLTKVDDSLSGELIIDLLNSEELDVVIELFEKHLYTKEGKITKFFDLNSISSDSDREIATDIINQFEEETSKSKMLELCLNGRFNKFPKEYVFGNFRELSRDQTKRIFESNFLSSEEKFQLMKHIIEFNNQILSKTKDTRKGKSGEKLSEDEYWQLTSESYEALLNIANKTLTSDQFREIESLVIDIFPDKIEYVFWEKGLINKVPIGSIAKKLLAEDYGYEQLKESILKGKFDKKDAVEIVNNNLKNFGVIRSKTEFQFLHKHITILCKFDQPPAEDVIASENKAFLKTSLWLNKEMALKVDEIKPVFPFFDRENQIKFVRHLFHLEHAKSNVTTPNRHFYDLVDIDGLDMKPILSDDEILIDYSVLVLIHGLKSLEENGRLLFDSELLKLFYKSISNNKKKAAKAEYFFDKCEGRYEDEYNWRTEGTIKKVYFGSGKFYYAISFTPGEQKTATNRGGYSYTYFEKNYNFEHLKEEVKKIPGRKWNPDKEHWGVPAKYKEQVYEFAAENRFFIDEEGSNYKNNTHLAEFKRGNIPNGITYCEGRLSNKPDNKYGKKFWWCNNRPCFQNCKKVHSPDEWEEYTMLDMLKIKGFNLDDTNRVGDRILDGQYYQFISSVNRFNQLVDHLFCQECSQVLYPVDDSHFAKHRVTHFHCTNPNCSKHHQDVYLHHCLNGKCNGVIDSRVSAKCPNGLHICSNEACGSCCSTDMFKRRLDNLQQVGGYIHQDLQHAVQNNLGHLERKEYFCYNCGNGMNKHATDVYYCENCDITYEIGKDNYNSGSSSSYFNDMDDDEPY